MIYFYTKDADQSIFQLVFIFIVFILKSALYIRVFTYVCHFKFILFFCNVHLYSSKLEYPCMVNFLSHFICLHLFSSFYTKYYIHHNIIYILYTFSIEYFYTSLEHRSVKVHGVSKFKHHCKEDLHFRSNKNTGIFLFLCYFSIYMDFAFLVKWIGC